MLPDTEQRKLYRLYKAHGLSFQLVSLFQRTIYRHFKKQGRDLPWRRRPAHGPPRARPGPTAYRVLVSEIMLQQTPVDRVVPKFKQWLITFPTLKTLARAPFNKVLRLWSGLGYNRRARYVHQTARLIVKNYGGRLPRTVEKLAALPGIGQGTAKAIAAFAYNQPVVFIETNIRSVYLHFFFPRQRRVPDSKLLPLVKATFDRRSPRRWYAALMDYGAWLKRTVPNPSRRSAHHSHQQPFAGSDRQLRGAVIRALLDKPQTFAGLKTLVPTTYRKRLGMIIQRLVKEKLIVRRSDAYRIDDRIIY